MILTREVDEEGCDGDGAGSGIEGDAVLRIDMIEEMWDWVGAIWVALGFNSKGRRSKMLQVDLNLGSAFLAKIRRSA